jgi:hypothetical protein
MSGNRRHSNCESNKQTALYPARQKIKVDVYLVQHKRNNKKIRIDGKHKCRSLLTHIYQRLRLEIFAPYAAKTR